MSEEARTGRHRQRYADNNVRLVAGCIPYRLRQGGDSAMSLEGKLEVLMISSPNRHDLVFPKGGWEEDETLEQAACREAFEEAGIRGILHETRLGPWVSRSKSSESSSSSDGYCRCYMFAFEVTEEVQSWPEQASHQRRWLPASKAQGLCRYPWMEEALEECINLLLSEDAPSASASDAPHSVKPLEPGFVDNGSALPCAFLPRKDSPLRVDRMQQFALGPQRIHSRTCSVDLM